MNRINRIIAAVMAVIMIVILFPATAIPVDAASDLYYDEFGVTYNQLFDLYPEYLNSYVEDQVTEVVIKQYTNVLERHKASDDYIPVLITAIREDIGFSIALREILAELNLSESTEKQMLLDTTTLLLKNICNSETAASAIISDVEKNFSALKGVYDLTTAAGKESFIKNLKSVCKWIPDSQIDSIAEELFSEDTDKLFGKISETIELCDVLTTFFAMQEIETGIIKIIIDSVPQNCGLRDALNAYLEERGTAAAFIDTYLNDKVIDYVSEKLLKLATSVSVPVKVAAEALSFCADVLYNGPDATDIYAATALSGYVQGLYSAVATKRNHFRQTALVSADEIAEYEVLYTAYIEAIRTALESTKPLASTAQQGNIDTAVALCDKLTYDNYIRLCMEELKADIDAGIISAPKVSVTGLSVPTTLNCGDRFRLMGTVAAQYLNIVSISFAVYDSDGTWKTGGSANVNGKSYVLDNSTVDMATEFNVLKAGIYRCELLAHVDNGTSCEEVALYSDKLIVKGAESSLDVPQAESADFISRSDGVWLYPLPSNHYAVNDWAGCSGNNPCYFHPNTIPGCIPEHNDEGTYGHNGIDLEGVAGATEVYAAADGILYCTNTNWKYRGITAVIEHDAGYDRDGNKWSYYSVYQHLSVAETSMDGEKVNSGDVIAKVGATDGFSGCGQHLHFEILLGKSGQGYQLSRDTNNQLTTLDAFENYGWIMSEGYQTGRILNNPALNSPAGTPRYNYGCEQTTRAHAGSVMYTFDKSEVCIGETSATAYIAQCTYYPSYGSIQITKDNANIMDRPCSAKTDSKAVLVESAKLNATYEVIGLYENTAGNNWYMVKAESGTGYIYSENCTFISGLYSDVKLTDPNIPTELLQGKMYNLGGTITSPYTQLLGVAFWVYDSKGQAKTGNAVEVSGSSYQLSTPAIDYAVVFNDLEVGDYQCVVTAKVLSYFVNANGRVGIQHDLELHRSSLTIKDPANTYHTLTFNANGGVIAQTSMAVVKGGKPVGLPVPEWDKKYFVGWFTAAEGGTQVTKDTIIHADMTLYAHWGYPKGDFDGDMTTTNADVVYLLWHTLFPEDYPVDGDADFTGDNKVSNEDVVYLLWHTLFPEDYPLNTNSARGLSALPAENKENL